MRRIIRKRPLVVTALLAVSISCTTTSSNQTANLSPGTTAGSGTAPAASNESSQTQNSAPEEVVKKLFKLHDMDKSPLYKAKTRGEMESFFAKDFVKLVWVDGKEPNLMSKLAIEGDVLTGLDGLSKAEGENIEKARIAGDKATVPVTVNAVDEENKKTKRSLNYELVKENAGWRITDIKYDGFYSNSLVDTINDLKKTSVEESAKLDEEFKDVKPPFVGTRWFNTDPENSGSGTARHYLKINENHYAFCGFVQTNQADGNDTKEEIALGKFRKTFDCNFENGLGGKHSYQIEGNSIYELDKNKQVIKSSRAAFTEGD